MLRKSELLNSHQFSMATADQPIALLGNVYSIQRIGGYLVVMETEFLLKLIRHKVFTTHLVNYLVNTNFLVSS